MNLDIRSLSEADFEPLRQVLDTVAREKRYLAFTQAPDREEAHAFYRQILVNGDVCSIVLRDGVVVGWCDVLPMHGQARAHVGTLGMGLLPALRHQGVGRRLIDTSIARAQAKGFIRVELTVRSDNANAKALYERVGFVSEGLMRRALRIDGEYHDMLAMALLS